MAKVVVKSLKAKSRKKPDSVREKRVRGADGTVTVVRSLDADSPTFGRDLEYVFAKNVEKARRDNKRITGSLDIAIDKR